MRFRLVTKERLIGAKMVGTGSTYIGDYNTEEGIHKVPVPTT